MKVTILVLLLGFLVLPAMADHQRITIHVNGMVCSFCSQGLTKKFQKESTVSKVDVSLEKKVVQLALKDNADLSDGRIKELISEAGFNVEQIERNSK